MAGRPRRVWWKLSHLHLLFQTTRLAHVINDLPTARIWPRVREEFPQSFHVLGQENVYGKPGLERLIVAQQFPYKALQPAIPGRELSLTLHQIIFSFKLSDPALVSMLAILLLSRVELDRLYFMLSAR